VASVTKVGVQTGSLTEAVSKVNVRGHFAGESDGLKFENISSGTKLLVLRRHDVLGVFQKHCRRILLLNPQLALLIELSSALNYALN
jgi:hypothetical protein